MSGFIYWILDVTTMYLLVNIINICSLYSYLIWLCLKLSLHIFSTLSTHEYFSKVLSTYLSTFTKCVLSTYTSTFKIVSTQYSLEYLFLVLASSLQVSKELVMLDDIWQENFRVQCRNFNLSLQKSDWNIWGHIKIMCVSGYMKF